MSKYKRKIITDYSISEAKKKKKENSSSPCKRLGLSHLHELHESKRPFVSLIKFIRFKLPFLYVHANGVITWPDAGDRVAAEKAPSWFPWLVFTHWTSLTVRYCGRALRPEVIGSAHILRPVTKRPGHNRQRYTAKHWPAYWDVTLCVLGHLDVNSANAGVSAQRRAIYMHSIQ